MRHSIFLILFFSVFFSFGQEKLSNRTLDSISAFIKGSKDVSFTSDERIAYANKAISYSNSFGNDSTLIKSYKALSSVYLNEWDIENLKSVNFKILKLADKNRDTTVSANANYILGFAYHDELRLDSAYFYYSKAVKQFKAIGKTKSYLDVLINMSDIQHTERDYIGAEINAVSALKTLEDLPKTDDNIELQWSRYNLIGIISGELKNYEKALEYHKLAFNVIKGHPKEYFYRVYSKNNIASIYRRAGDYKQAVELFNEILEDKILKTSDSLRYANITANLGYSQFLSGNYNKETVNALFKESFQLAKELDDKIEIMATSAYYSEFLNKENEKDSAKKYVNLAYKIAKDINMNDFVFQTLKVKSQLEKDSSNLFLNEYIKLNDSLITAERSIRNKFARIDYETDVIKQEKEAISRQNLWLLITSIGLLLSILLLYIIKTQREKNKELQLVQQQQEANEEIYNLMLSQQDKMDEARAIEKKRISQELHDGILGRLFGARLSLDSLNYSTTEEAINNRFNYIDELKGIEQDIRKVSHDLNTDFITQASFSEMLNTLITTQCNAYKINYKATISDKINWDDITNITKIHIYRIVQESLQNIYKHAKAKLINVTLKQEDNLISLSIIDNGVGYDKSKQKEGIGLKNIKSRVSAIGGKQIIDSQINQGTTINIEIPI